MRSIALGHLTGQYFVLLWRQNGRSLLHYELVATLWIIRLLGLVFVLSEHLHELKEGWVMVALLDME